MVPIGFDTAVTTAMEALDMLHTTVESPHRVLVIEVMGRHVGWITLVAGVAGGADVLLPPEIAYHLDVIADKITQRHQSEAPLRLVVVAEGSRPHGGAPACIGSGRAHGRPPRRADHRRPSW